MLVKALRIGVRFDFKNLHAKFSALCKHVPEQVRADALPICSGSTHKCSTLAFSLSREMAQNPTGVSSNPGNIGFVLLDELRRDRQDRRPELNPGIRIAPVAFGGKGNVGQGFGLVGCGAVLF